MSRENVKELNQDEIDYLESKSDRSEFWQDLLDYHTEHGFLTPRQYAVLIDSMQGGDLR